MSPLGALPHINARLTQIRPPAPDDGYRAGAAAPARWAGDVGVLVDQRRELAAVKGDEEHRTPVMMAIDTADVLVDVTLGDLVTFTLDESWVPVGGLQLTLRVRAVQPVDAVGLLMLELVRA